MNVDWTPDRLPPGTGVEPVTLPTPDRSATGGLVYRPAGRVRALVAIAHPRVDMSSHYMVPPLLRAGYAVWTQRPRTVNNDLTAIHEQLLVDVATAHAHLAEQGFDRIFLLGNSGGASLYCLYAEQAERAPNDRLDTAPSGLPVDLDLEMPSPAGLILLAPHRGQGELLLQCIDPSVADEADPLSVISELDPFDPANGFREPPQPASFADEFLARFRAAQRERVARIDERARGLVARRGEARRRAKADDGGEARRAASAPAFLTVYRTDADPRTVDLSLDPSKRDYGSIFGRRPDVTNYGPVGFGRLTTPDAWLSTWSGLSSRATLRLTAREIRIPTLVLAYTADNSVFPSDISATFDELGSAEKELVEIEADHFGYAPGTEDRVGGREAADAAVAWLEKRVS